MKMPSMFGLFKAAPVRNENDTPRSAVTSFGERRVISVIKYQDAVNADEALKHPIVFRCINKIAQSVQMVPWRCIADPNVAVKDRAKASDIKRINELLNSPNDVLSASQFRYWLALNYICYARATFKVGVGVENTPNGLYPLTTTALTAVLNPRGIVTHYKFGMSENAELIPTRRQSERDNPIARKPYAYEIFKPNLAGTFDGTNMTVLQSIGLPAQIITLLLQRAADTASGHPNTKYIVSAEKLLTTDQQKAMRNAIENRAADEESSGQVLFLHNTKVEVEKLDNDLGDIHSKMPLDDMARQIAGAFDIPIALIGIGAADGAKFASNYAESRQAFWQDTIDPGYLSPIEIGMTQALCPPGAIIQFDRDAIPALSQVRIANAEKVSKITFITRNEKRELTDFPAVEGGDVFDETPLKTSETENQ